MGRCKSGSSLFTKPILKPISWWQHKLRQASGSSRVWYPGEESLSNGHTWLVHVGSPAKKKFGFYSGCVIITICYIEIYIYIFYIIYIYILYILYIIYYILYIYIIYIYLCELTIPPKDGWEAPWYSMASIICCPSDAMVFGVNFRSV